MLLIHSRSSAMVDRCALIHCHRPDLIDYDKLDKVMLLVNTRTDCILTLGVRLIGTATLVLPSKLHKNTSVFLSASSSCCASMID